MLINCPECGHQVSDKAPVCPHCGVEIAKILAAHKSDTENAVARIYTQTAEPTKVPQPEPSVSPEQPEKSRATLYLVLVIIVMLLLGGGFWAYNRFATNGDEEMAYQEAMRSDEIGVLQNYLIDYKNTNPEHRDSIQVRLTRMNELNKQWNDVLVSNSRSAFQHWLDEHPSGPYKQAAEHKIDSMDWASAVDASTVEAIKSYIERHRDNGEHLDEADEKIRTMSATTLQPDEQLMVESVFRSFFQAINNKDEDRLLSNVTTLLHTFIGKSDATKSDVALFLKKLWKEDVLNLNWTLGDDYRIEKKEVMSGEYEYTVSVSAVQHVEKNNGDTENRYRISAKLNTDGKITDFSMKKILNDE